jgi:hypothetical protein
MSENEGWGFPTFSNKAHYFLENGMSLCNKYGFYRGPKEGADNSSGFASERALLPLSSITVGVKVNSIYSQKASRAKIFGYVKPMDMDSEKVENPLSIGGNCLSDMVFGTVAMVSGSDFRILACLHYLCRSDHVGDLYGI